MTKWEIWRHDCGDQSMVSQHEDRIGALAHLLALRSDSDTPGTYALRGPDEPACRTNRDLYQHVLREGERMKDRTLQEFLRAWWWVGRSLSDQERLDLDAVAAMMTAAGSIDPPPLCPQWRTAVFAGVVEPTSYADWESIVLSQIADLADFADAGPLSEYASLGEDAPRPQGASRATDPRWYNFHPRGYLECGMAGSLAGWDEDDQIRQPVPGPVVALRAEPEPGERQVTTVSWGELADLAICGQVYE